MLIRIGRFMTRTVAQAVSVVLGRPLVIDRSDVGCSSSLRIDQSMQ